MRRSAAPSSLGEGVRAKRMKFQPPLANNIETRHTAFGRAAQQSNAKLNLDTDRPHFLPTSLVKGEDAPSASLRVPSSSEKYSAKDDGGCSALQRALKELRNGSSEMCSVKPPSSTHTPASAGMRPTSTANSFLPPSTGERGGKGGALGSNKPEQSISVPPQAPPTSLAAPKVPVGGAQPEVGSGGTAVAPSGSCKYFSVMW